MNAIVCVDRNWAIGRQGQLLFRLSEDLRQFKALTMGGRLLMGRHTFDSLPGLLPGRTHIVLSRDAGFAPEGVTVLRSLDEARAYMQNKQNLWLIGGAEVYAALLPLCKAACVTKVDAAFTGADAFFPNIDKLPAWHCAEEGSWRRQEGLRFKFCWYEKDA